MESRADVRKLPPPPAEEVETESFAIPLETVDDETGPIAVTPYRLLCVAGKDLGRVFPLARYPALIGRGSVDVSIHGGDISRHHACISRNGESFWIEDLGSTNGTFINGAAIRGRTPLSHGDRIQIGSSILILARHDELEARMQRLARLEATSSGLSGMAHDFRNALQVVMVGLDELEALDDAARPAVIEDMKRATAAASNLAKRLISLGRGEPTALAPLELLTLVRETVAMARRLITSNIEISVDVSPHAVVQGAYEELQQVVLNLLINARDAIATTGAITISSRPTRLERPAALACHLSGEGDYIELSIADTGCGMDDTTLARVFEPFFTTKPEGQGSGLGLAMAHAIIRRHGGTVLVESAPGQGTTFRILLPSGRARTT